MSNLNVAESEIFERFAGIVARSLHIDRERITPEAYLSDLGAESLDLLEITMEAEDEFAILMPQRDILHIAQEVSGAGVLVAEGKLTDQGARFLQRRMPDLAADGILVTGMAVNQVARAFQRVGTWVRMIQGLLEHSPRVCPSCAAALAKAVAGRKKCPGCSTEVELPTGDDLNRRWVEEYFRGEVPNGDAQVA